MAENTWPPIVGNGKMCNKNQYDLIGHVFLKCLSVFIFESKMLPPLMGLTAKKNGNKVVRHVSLMCLYVDFFFCFVYV